VPSGTVPPITPGISSKSTKRKIARRAPAVPAPELRKPGKVLGPRANRTIAAIIDATRQVFLTRGYAGTTIDEIAKAADVSRASFYTYFPSKRDALLALGAESAHEAAELIAQIDLIPRPWTYDDIAGWVAKYFALLDDHGSFAFAWTQAAHEDAELLRAGAKSHLELCRRIGAGFAALADVQVKAPTEFGLVVFSMLERTWSYRQLYAETIDHEATLRSVTDVIVALLRCPPGGNGRRL
jgi:AcrR family transcriptional regulator